MMILRRRFADETKKECEEWKHWTKRQEQNECCAEKRELLLNERSPLRSAGIDARG